MAKLNPFLTSFREEVNKRYPKRSKRSDGTIGDRAHAARYSEHNPDRDGSIDAWDCDVNLLGSRKQSGSVAERVAMANVIAQFQALPQAELVIWRRRIASRERGWRWRHYSGPNPHDHHVHFQASGRGERTRFRGVVRAANYASVKKAGSRLKKALGVAAVSIAAALAVVPGAGTPAPHPVTVKPKPSVSSPAPVRITPVKPKPAPPAVKKPAPKVKVPKFRGTWAQLKQAQRLLGVKADGDYGPKTRAAIRKFQKAHGLKADGKLGPKTWGALHRK